MMDVTVQIFGDGFDYTNSQFKTTVFKGTCKLPLSPINFIFTGLHFTIARLLHEINFYLYLHVNLSICTFINMKCE